VATDVPCGLLTVTFTHRALPGEGGTTTSDVAVCETIFPVPALPKVTAVASARPPPATVMALAPETDPESALRPATDGQPSPPCRAMARSSAPGACPTPSPG